MALTRPQQLMLPTGSVIQVVTAVFSTQRNTTSSTAVATGDSLVITPQKASSKILVTWNAYGYVTQNSQGRNWVFGQYGLYRGTTQLITNGISINTGASTCYDCSGAIALSYVDSPATTSAVTYNAYFWSGSGINFSVYTNWSGSPGIMTAMEIAA